MAAGIVTTIRRLTAPAIEPIEVSFRHASPASVLEHRRILGPRVRFDQRENALLFRTADLVAPMVSANPALLEAFEQQAQRLIDELETRGPVRRRVLEVLARGVKGVVPDLAEVARLLAMSERSIQRHLREEGTSFRELTDDVRRRLALTHIAVPGTTVADVAFLMGFSEPSAFTRAFCRWTGRPPSEVREP